MKKQILISKVIILSYIIILYILLIIKIQINLNNIDKVSIKKSDNIKSYINENCSTKDNKENNKCFISFDNPNLRIAHFILTRFLINFWKGNGFPNKMYTQDYITNGIRVMHKYLLPSLENQLCKNFTWILLLGNEANITYIKSELNFNYSFEYTIVYQKNLYDFLKKLSNNLDVLITTRIDYDDRIYYDAVNDVRKTINIYKPIVIHGYNRGVCFKESNGEYYEFYRSHQNEGASSVFASLIIILDKVNDIYTIYDLSGHPYIRKTFLKRYKSFGIKELDYEPAVFDSGSPKFVWVRQNYSGLNNSHIPFYLKQNKTHFNLNIFYGKKII